MTSIIILTYLYFSQNRESVFPIVGLTAQAFFFKKAYPEILYIIYGRVKHFQICVLCFLHTNEYQQVVLKHYCAALVE